MGDEKNNIWRIVANNKSYLIMIRIDIKESYDVEISKKVAMTIACIYGAFTMRNSKETAVELKKYWSIINTESISKDKSS